MNDSVKGLADFAASSVGAGWGGEQEQWFSLCPNSSHCSATLTWKPQGRFKLILLLLGSGTVCQDHWGVG